MDKVNSCIERIRVIRGVNYGIITNEQIRELFVFYNFNEEQKRNVYAALEKGKITPIPESEVHQNLRDLRNPPRVEIVAQERQELSELELRRKRLEKELDIYRQDLRDDPTLASIYEEEIPIFMKALADVNDKPSRTFRRKIVKACMTVSDYRVREDRKSGWVCGTYMSHVRDYFERWVQMAFCEDELAELIDCSVSSKTLTQEQLEKVQVLLHNTPKTLVRRSNLSFFLDDDGKPTG